jgi:hypothetical protein
MTALLRSALIIVELNIIYLAASANQNTVYRCYLCSGLGVFKIRLKITNDRVPPVPSAASLPIPNWIYSPPP